MAGRLLPRRAHPATQRSSPSRVRRPAAVIRRVRARLRKTWRSRSQGGHTMTSRSISVFLGVASASLLLVQVRVASQSATMPQDPGPRAGTFAGDPLSGLTASQTAFFEAGRDDFNESDGVAE